MLLKGKVAMITGCNRGIGKAILEKFAQNGCTIYANSRSVGSLDALAIELQNKYECIIIPIYFDVCDDMAVKKCFLKIKKEQGKLDILVNNAGIMKDAIIGMIDMETCKKTFEVNVFSVISMIQLAVKLMKKNGNGSIINLASIVGIEGNVGQTVYSASKGAVIALTKTASKELCPSGIRVNAIAPGMVDTDMFRSIGQARIEKMIEKIGMARLCKPEEIADTALYLASDLAEYVTGQIIGVNGGAVI